MKKEMKKARDTAREDLLSSRVMAVFTAAIVMLLGLSYLWNAYDVGRTFFLAGRINNILLFVSAAGLVAGLVWLVRDARAGRLRDTIFNGAFAFMFFLVLFLSLLLIKYNYTIARRVLYIVIPAIAVLHLVFSAFQREFFSLCLTHSAVCCAMWIIAKTSNNRLATLSAIGAICVCAAAVLIYLKASRSGGFIGSEKLGFRIYDGEPSRACVFAIYGITALMAAAAYILAAPVAYYLLYAVAFFMLIAAVYFTVKLI